MAKKTNSRAKNKVSIRAKQKKQRRDNKVKRKVVIQKNDKADSKLKQKVKKVLRSNEKRRKVDKKPKNSFILSSTQKADLGKYQIELNSKNIKELKEILKKNNQVMTGIKGDLVERCAQGKVLGAVPNCPKCIAGKLRFNIKTGAYVCPGYMNDTDFVHCNFKATEGINRNTWVD
jgi:hypothetical protein